MQAILLSREEVAKRAKKIYESKIRQAVETEENIGRMIIIDIETGEYEIDQTGLQASRNLRTKNPYARLFGIRIGYNVVASFGGVMERVSSDFRYCD
jgi:phenylalanyl-tRNA synthetase beta subunit